MIEAEDEVVEMLFNEIRTLRRVAERLDKALRYGGRAERALALALYEQTKRGANK